MKKLIYIMLCICFLGMAQDPQIEWQNTIGGNMIDRGEVSVVGPDGNILIASYSLSGVSGDRTEASLGGGDVWLVNIDVNGNILWQKAIGGSGNDFPAAMYVTNDGGYILSVQSDSNASIYKSEDSKGGRDFWIVKLDANGSIVWENTIGGNLDEGLPKVIQTLDGSFLVAGLSLSGISGDKTEANIGSQDYWVLKLNASGTIVWQNTIGGSDYDSPHSIVALEDGSILVGGASRSNISGDKTENSKGLDDFWLVKLDDTGAVLWDKTIGGSDFDSLNTILVENETTIILSGTSFSGVSGDKTEPSRGSVDVWVVKINVTGTIIDQAAIGGSGADTAGYSLLASNGNLLISASSNSPISGEKTEDSQGDYDYWVLGLDPNLNLIYQNTIGGSGADNAGPILITNNERAIITGTSNSDISGDKNENSNGDKDIWALQIDPAGVLATPEFYGNELSVYPIPVSETINFVSATNAIEQVAVLDILGRTVSTFTANKKMGSLSLENLNAGVYFLSFQVGSQQIVKKIVKQ